MFCIVKINNGGYFVSLFELYLILAFKRDAVWIDKACRLNKSDYSLINWEITFFIRMYDSLNEKKMETINFKW